MLDNQELLALVRHHLQRNEIEGALVKVKQVLESDQPPDEALVLAGRVYAQIGMFDRAQAHYQRYLEAHPEAAHEIFELGMTYAQQNRSAEALQEWTRALTLVPMHPPALFFSADMLARGGKPAEARRHLDVLLKSAAPDNMYVERAAKLLQALESAQPAGPFAGTADVINPYGRH